MVHSFILRENQGQFLSRSSAIWLCYVALHTHCPAFSSASAYTLHSVLQQLKPGGDSNPKADESTHIMYDL
jgi:hypothetical protein